jgi:hypothetical protein
MGGVWDFVGDFPHVSLPSQANWGGKGAVSSGVQLHKRIAFYQPHRSWYARGDKARSAITCTVHFTWV